MPRPKRADGAPRVEPRVGAILFKDVTEVPVTTPMAVRVDYGEYIGLITRALQLSDQNQGLATTVDTTTYRIAVSRLKTAAGKCHAKTRIKIRKGPYKEEENGVPVSVAEGEVRLLITAWRDVGPSVGGDHQEDKETEE